MRAVLSFFLIFTIWFGVSVASAKNSDPCFNKIRQDGFICWGPSGQNLNDPNMHYVCGPTPPNIGPLLQKYEEELEAIYHHFPLSLQRIFCTLNHTVIEPKEFFWAGEDFVQDPNGKIIGAILALNEVLLNGGFSMSQFLVSAARMPFGKATPMKIFAPDIPDVSTPALFSVAHEFGHILDSYNESISLINPHGCEMDSSPYTVKPCPARPRTWMSLSWINARESIFDTNIFPLRTRTFGPFPHGDPLTTGPFLPAELIDETYDELNKSSFISYLGAYQPYDDWAETVAWLTYTKLIRGTTVLYTAPSGKTYSPSAHLNSQVFSKKKKFALRILRSPKFSVPR